MSEPVAAAAAGGSGPQPEQTPGKGLDWELLIGRLLLPVLIGLTGVVMIAVGHATYPGILSDNNPSDPQSISTDFTQIVDNHNALLSALGVVFIIIALMVWLLNWLMRMNRTDGADRAKEEDARDYLRTHGHWPDEEA